MATQTTQQSRIVDEAISGAQLNYKEKQAYKSGHGDIVIAELVNKAYKDWYFARLLGAGALVLFLVAELHFFWLSNPSLEQSFGIRFAVMFVYLVRLGFEWLTLHGRVQKLETLGVLYRIMAIDGAATPEPPTMSNRE